MEIEKILLSVFAQKVNMTIKLMHNVNVNLFNIKYD